MEIDQVKAIRSIVLLEIGMGVITYYSDSTSNMGTIGMGISTIARIVGMI